MKQTILDLEMRPLEGPLLKVLLYFYSKAQGHWCQYIAPSLTIYSTSPFIIAAFLIPGKSYLLFPFQRLLYMTVQLITDLYLYFQSLYIYTYIAIWCEPE